MLKASMPSPFFAALECEQLRPDTFDQALEKHAEELICVFFWGHDCLFLFHTRSQTWKNLTISWNGAFYGGPARTSRKAPHNNHPSTKARYKIKSMNPFRVSLY